MVALRSHSSGCLVRVDFIDDRLLLIRKGAVTGKVGGEVLPPYPSYPPVVKMAGSGALLGSMVVVIHVY